MENIIIATRSDLDAARETAPEEYRKFIELLKASTHTVVDTQAYPEGYDHTLTPEQAGYIEPVIEDRATPDTAARFGFTPKELASAED